MRAPIAAALTLALAALATGAAAQQVQEVTVRLDPATGHVEIETRLDAPEGAVLLPGLDWLGLDSLTVDGAPVEASASLPASRHGGRPVVARLDGTLPDIAPGIAPWGQAHGAGYLTGGDWLPHEADAVARFEVTLEMPAAYRGLATGSLAEERVSGDTYTARFDLTGRADDLGLFFGPYQIGEAMRGAVRLRTYFRPGDTGLSGAYLDAAGGYVARYADQIGPYPYAGFSVVSAPIPVGLGFAGLTYVSQSILSHPYMRGRSLAHEVLHNWWGNAVGVDYDSGNWCEGLTTFQADYALAEAAGPDDAEEMRLEWLRALAGLAPAENTALRAFRAASHGGVQAVGYGKAAMVFHMLKAEIGAQAFDAALRRFYAAERGRIADWTDLQAAFEAETGRDLGWFFAQWIDRAGLPEIALAAAAPVAGEGGPGVRVTLSQSAPAYRLRVPVRIATEAGMVERVMELSGASATQTFALDAAPTGIDVDPGFELARVLLPGEVAPTLGDVFGNRSAKVAVAGDAPGLDAAARGLAVRLLRSDRLEVVPAAALDGAPAALVIGLTGDVAALRDARIAGPAPWDMTTGTARAWAERDAGGRTWIFVSADNADLLGAEMGRLGYQAGRSYAAFAGGQEVAAGTWAPAASPLHRAFE